MLTWEEVEALVKSEAAVFAQRVREAASGSTTEATFRDRLMPILADFCSKVGIEFAPKGGYSLLSGGKPDTVFNRLVIEYKSPGILQDSNAHPKNKGAIIQLKDYIEDIVQRERHRANRMAGVVLDGNYFIFLRKFEEWKDDPPVSVTSESVAQFLRYLVSLNYGIALTSDNLVRDFGMEQPRTQRIVQSLEAALRDPPAPLVTKLFEQWKTLFSEVIEYKEAFSGTKLKELKGFAARVGIELKQPEPFFFALHTYFALLVKLLAWLALYRYLGGRGAGPSFGSLATRPSAQLKGELSRMEHGEVFREIYGIRNLLEGDFFLWYLHAWNEPIESALRELIARLSDYDPATLGVDPKETRDLFKKLYHKLMPKDIRHNLGEYYTPDWLAQRLLNQVDSGFFDELRQTSGYLRDNLLKLRFLDPACGSGTFLALIISRIKEVGKALPLPEGAVLEAILKNVKGIDLNPLAVITARTTYILALGDLLEYKLREIDIPVYLADSIVTPSKGEDLWIGGKYSLPTSVGKFLVPEEVIDERRFDALCQLLDVAVRDEVSEETFIENCQADLKLEAQAFDKAKDALAELYRKISELHEKEFNGLWARVLRNGFAPLFIGKFDYVVGNPPWVNWENLPDSYRDRKEVRRLWQFHGLFPKLGGMDTILGKVKYDISVLMTYEAMHRYLRDGGKLGFVITQSVFKTAGAGQGFRRFLLGDSTYIKVLHVDDMVELKPFEAAANRTSIVILEKGRPTTYPLPYTCWKKTAKGKSIGFDNELSEVEKMTERLRFYAEPVNARDKTSAWLTGRPLAVKAIKKVLGQSDYEAHAGVYSGGANGVYWLNIIERRPDGSVEVENITEGQKRKVESTPAVIEGDLLYPLLRGRDVKRWLAEPSAYILMPHLPGMKLKAVPEAEMQLDYRKTWSYLKQFEALLRSRAAYKRYFREDAPFYSMFDVGDYTFAPYKVVWPWISIGVESAVVSLWEGKRILPEHNTSFVDCQHKADAYFISALLNSAVGDFSIRAYYSGSGGGIASPHVLQNIRIPKFDPQNPLHRRLAELSERAHREARAGNDQAVVRTEEEINREAARLWGITDQELSVIKRSLAEIS